MKPASTIHKLAAVAIFLVWVAMIVAMIVNLQFWAPWLLNVLLFSVATMVGTVLLSWFWIRHKSVPSYGSIFVFPSVCVFLWYFLIYCHGGGWSDIFYIFTLRAWYQEHEGPGPLLRHMVEAFWFICSVPAASVVIYFQKPHDSA